MSEEGPRQNKTVVYECELCDHLSRTQEEANAHRDNVPVGPKVDVGLVYQATQMHREKHLFVVTGDDSKPGEDHKYRYQGRSLEGEMPEDFDGKMFLDKLMDGSYSLLKDDGEDLEAERAMLEKVRADYQAKWDEMDEEDRAKMPKPEELRFRLSPKFKTHK